MTVSLLAASFVALDLTDSGVLADEVPLDMTPGNTYDLDFSEDSFGNTVTYKMTYTAGKTTDYELVTSGSHKLTIRLQHKTSYGSESVKDYKITDIDENNVSFVCPLKAGETYFFRISLKNRDYKYPNSDSFEGPNDVKITFKEYQDTSPVIANFNATDFPDANFRAYI